MTMAEDELQKPIEHRIEPIGKTINYNGVEYRAFTLEEYKELKHLFVDYHLLWKYSISLELDIISYEDEIAVWQFRVDAWKEETDRQIKYAKQLSNLFDEEHKLRLKIEKSARFSNWIPWTLTAIEAIALSVVGIAYATK